MAMAKWLLESEMVTERKSFSMNDQVRFTQEQLDVLTAQDRGRLEGRVGVVQGFHNGTRKPIVYFPEVHGQSDLRLFGIDTRHLEHKTEDAVQPDDHVQLSDQDHVSAKLSQDETDHLFD